MEPGDKVKVKKSDGKELKGILMPRSEIADEDKITIKLDSGYNVGIKEGEIESVDVIEEGEDFEYESEGSEKILVDDSLPTVALLGCGGTISSRIDYRTGAVRPAFSPTDLVDFVPKIKEVANVKGKKLFDLLSENMGPEHWKKITEECKNQIEEGIDGIVITQGTDTMHYTAAALSFMLQDPPVPIVITGAQRSSDRGSCDSRMNLLCSFRVATSDMAEVMVCMHGEIEDTFCFAHEGTHVRKMHTSRRDAFQSINRKPYAKVWFEEDKIEYLRDDFNERRGDKEFEVDKNLNPDVGLVWVHPGIKSEYIRSLASDYDGIVLAGTGLGHAPGKGAEGSILPALKDLIDKDVPVVMTSQTLYGRIQMRVYSNGRDLLEAGVIPSHTLPEVALIKLMWALGHTEEMEEVREMMLKDQVGELIDRINPKTFPDLREK